MLVKFDTFVTFAKGWIALFFCESFSKWPKSDECVFTMLTRWDQVCVPQERPLPDNFGGIGKKLAINRPNLHNASFLNEESSYIHLAGFR